MLPCSAYVFASPSVLSLSPLWLLCIILVSFLTSEGDFFDYPLCPLTLPLLRFTFYMELRSI